MTKRKLILTALVLIVALPAWSWAGYFVTYASDTAVLVGFTLYALIVAGVCWAFYGLLQFAVVKLNEWESR